MPLAQPFQLPWPLSVGDRAPAWTLPSSGGGDLEAGRFIGRPLALCFLPADRPAAEQVAAGFRELHERYAQTGAAVACVLRAAGEPPGDWAARLGLPFPVLADADGSVGRAFAAAADQAPAGRTFVLDPSGRVVTVRDPGEPGEHAREVYYAVAAFVYREMPRHFLVHAPVLHVPDVLSSDVCRELIRVWETQGNEDSGFMVQRDGKTVGVLDYGHKIRRDHFVREGELKKRLMFAVYHRVRPEIKKAFQFDVSRFEDFRIACYDAERGGYFRPHRDNTTTGTAHRAWAMTLNLNAGDYEGGYLRFPEYGPHLYRPAPGGAVVFSCSLLHEATDVSAGRRFVLLSFLYGEREARLREELARRAAGTATPPG